jgi:Mrp family chromosome partitioning ATPase
MTVDKSAVSWEPSERLVIIVGNYGSGKTEVSVNLALRLAAEGKKVIIADLDIVNPYFRSREAGALMEANGIEVVIPPGEQQYADLPIVVPRIKTMLGPTDED